MNFKRRSIWENWTHREIFSSKKHKIKFDIRKFNGKYCVFIEDTVSSNCYNSLWKNILFDTPEQAFEFCEKFATFYKEKRIPDEGIGDTGHDRCNNKCDDFLEWLKNEKEE